MDEPDGVADEFCFIVIAFLAVVDGFFEVMQAIVSAAVFWCCVTKDKKPAIIPLFFVESVGPTSALLLKVGTKSAPLPYVRHVQAHNAMQYLYLKVLPTDKNFKSLS